MKSKNKTKKAIYKLVMIVPFHLAAVLTFWNICANKWLIQINDTPKAHKVNPNSLTRSEYAGMSIKQAIKMKLREGNKKIK